MVNAGGHLHRLEKIDAHKTWQSRELDIGGQILDDQTQVDSKPACRPEEASLNQCQLIAANSPKLVL